MLLKVGDKVKLKTLEQLKSEGWKMNTVGGLYHADFPFIFVEPMKEYLGKEVTINHVKGKMHNIFHIKEDYGFSWHDIFIDALEDASTYVDLKTATNALINGECDAIRYHDNNVVCAWYDKDTKGFYVSRLISRDPMVIKREYKPFFMHKDYMEDGSKWELIVDKSKRREITNCKKQLYKAILKLRSLNELSDFDVERIVDIVGTVNI